MISLWMMYSVTISLLLLGAAFLLERVFRWHRLPTRWVWAGAMTGSLLLPLAIPLLRKAPGAPPALTAPGAEGGSVNFGGIEVVSVSTGSHAGLGDSIHTLLVDASLALAQLDRPILTLWILTSLLLGGVLAASLLWIAQRRKSWQQKEIRGTRVLLSPDLGPAVIGVRRPAIVLPRWALDLEERALGIVLVHEEEHVAAKDTALLCGALLAMAATPWNLPLWWHFQRLRLAVECDCDRRVLRRGVSWNEYGAILLEVGRRVRRVGLPAAALTERTTLLERRLTMMKEAVPTRRRFKSAFALAVGGILLVMACEAPFPPGLTPTSEPDVALEAVDSTPTSPPNSIPTPTFTPFTVPPELKNPQVVQQALVEEYPAMLRDAGIGGTVLLHFLIDEKGQVRHNLMNRSSGNSALDKAALLVAQSFEFSPALNGHETVPVWISLPITFRTGEEAGRD